MILRLSMCRRLVLVALVTLLLGGDLLCGDLIAGTFRVANRSELLRTERQVRAAHFLSQTTFGPTMREIKLLARRIREIGADAAFSEWIDQQFAIPASHHEQTALDMISADGFQPLTKNIDHNRYKHQAWWHLAIAAPDQLRQRMAWALAQIFVISEKGSGFGQQTLDLSQQPQYLGVADYYDMLVDNSFGDYRDLLEDVTYHPIMGVYLSHLKNAKGNGVRFPDENFAREIQQVFSIGVYKLQLDGQLVLDSRRRPIENYDIETVESFARVFTGLTFDDSDRSFYETRRNFHARMVMRDAQHDTGEKALHNRVVLPAGRGGNQDISDALDNLAAHRNVAPFISRLLIQRFVKSNPSKRYIRRVAITFLSSRGDFKRVIKAILLDSEARDSLAFEQLSSPLRLRVTTADALATEHSRLREPVLRYAALIRAYGIANSNGYFAIPALNRHLNQQAYLSPSVFNFYLPDHRPAGGLANYQPSHRVPNGVLYAPEFQILSAVATNRLKNRFRSAVSDTKEAFTVLNTSAGVIRSVITLDLSAEVRMASDPEELVSRLDLLLCHGAMLDSTKAIISAAITEETTKETDRARGALLAVLSSPDCAVSK